jgi:hypothetical protein
MRHMRPITAATMLLAMVLVVGCQRQSVERTWATMRVGLTSAQNTALLLHERGLITDEELLSIDPGIQQARAALTQVEPWLTAPEEDWPEGKQEQLQALLRIAADALLAVEQSLADSAETPIE